MSGTGSGQGSSVYPATLAGVAIGARTFHPFVALAYDLGPLSAHYGSQLDVFWAIAFCLTKLC